MPSLIFRSCTLLALVVVGALAAFSSPTMPGESEQGKPHVIYEVQEKQSYLDRLFEPISMFTLLLVASTVALWRSTSKLASLGQEQAKLTADLFVSDQRPWLNVKLEISSKPIQREEDKGFHFSIRVRVSNLGKTPALDAGNGIQTHLGYEGFQERFDGMRQFCEAQSFSKGKTIFPSDNDDWSFDVDVTDEMIATSQSNGVEPMNFIIIGYHYQSTLNEAAHETVRMYLFGCHSAFDRLKEYGTFRKVELHLWKELVN